MATSDEVSTGQEVKEKSSIIDIKEREGAVLACASNKAQNAHFSHQHHHYAAYENDHGDVGGGEYASGYEGDVDNY